MPGILEGRQEEMHFPVPFDALRAQMVFERIQPGERFGIGGFGIQTVQLNHPGITLGYRIDHGDAVACHATDHEGGSESHDARLVEAARGADLLIHDAQFTPEEYERHRGWGHSHTGLALDNALAAGVRRLVLFHFDPTHADIDVDGQMLWARRRVAGGGLEVLAAAEGLELEVW